MDATREQVDYYKKLYSRFDDVKIKDYTKQTGFNLPPVIAFARQTSKRASSIITTMKAFLNLRENVKIHQTNSKKTLSNIYIRKEWIVDYNYGSNSILVDVPDYANNQIIRFDLPKGEQQKEDGKYTGKLIYTLKDLKYKGQIRKRNHVIKCGVYSTWTCWTRKFGSTYEDSKKKQMMYVDLFDVLEISNQIEEDILEKEEIDWIHQVDNINDRIEQMKKDNLRKSAVAQAKINLQNSKKARLKNIVTKVNINELEQAEPLAAESPPPEVTDDYIIQDDQYEQQKEVIDFELDEFF